MPSGDEISPEEISGGLPDLKDAVMAILAQLHLAVLGQVGLGCQSAIMFTEFNSQVGVNSSVKL